MAEEFLSYTALHVHSGRMKRKARSPSSSNDRSARALACMHAHGTAVLAALRGFSR